LTSVVGSSVASVPSVTGAVPTCERAEDAGLEGGDLEHVLEEVGVAGGADDGYGAAMLAPSAGAVISGDRQRASATDWATLKVVLPVTPPWLTLIVVLPSLSALATPATSMLATAGLLLVQVRPLVSGRLEPLLRMPVAAKAWLWPVRIRALSRGDADRGDRRSGRAAGDDEGDGAAAVDDVPAAGFWLMTRPAATVSLAATGDGADGQRGGADRALRGGLLLADDVLGTLTGTGAATTTNEEALRGEEAALVLDADADVVAADLAGVGGPLDQAAGGVDAHAGGGGGQREGQRIAGVGVAGGDRVGVGSCRRRRR
jgi:hypothetical protein